MFRALSTRRSSQGYDRLVVDDPTAGLLEAKLSRSRTTSTISSPGRLFNKSKKSTPESNFQPEISSKPDQSNYQAKSAAKEAKKASKIHPLFSLFEKSSKKKPTAKPEFARYVQYLKEGGAWDSNSAKPVIFYN